MRDEQVIFCHDAEFCHVVLDSIALWLAETQP